MPTRPYENAPKLPLAADADPASLLDPRALLHAEVDAVELEIGPGRGWFLVERLLAAPTRGIIGLEIRRKWAQVVDERLAGRGFGDRARVFAEDAKVALPRLAPNSLAVVYLHFPDPWWKKRHEKRRVITAALLGEIVRTLRSGGELFIQTDVEERAEAFAVLASATPGLVPATGGPLVEDNPYAARSPRERRAMQDGLPVFRLRYLKGELAERGS